MTTKRINDKYHRQDIKIPVSLYNQICDIATNEFKARVHHISNKPEISSTLLYLVELGIESLNNGNELIKKPNTDNYTDMIPITDNEVKELIKNALTPMHERLNDLVTIQSQVDKLSELIYRLTNTDTKPIDTDKLDNSTDNDTDKLTDNDKLSVAITEKLENITDNNIDILGDDTDTIKEDITENNTLSESPILPLNEDSPVIVPDEEKKADNSDIPEIGIKIKSFEDAVIEIKRLRKQRNGIRAIAKELTGKYATKQGKTNWSDTQVRRILNLQ